MTKSNLKVVTKDTFKYLQLKFYKYRILSYLPKYFKWKIWLYLTQFFVFYIFKQVGKVSSSLISKESR